MSMTTRLATLYSDKLVSAEEAVQAIRSNTRVYLGGGAGVPQVLERAMVGRAAELQDVEVVSVLTFAGGDYLQAQYAVSFRHRALFVGANAREAVNSGRADYVPVFLSEAPRLFKNGTLPVDVALIQVAPPDAHGWCSYGIEVGVTKPAAESAKHIIAEINPNMPRVLGDAFIHLSHLDQVVEVDYLLPEATGAEPTVDQERVGELVAELIPDEATLQLGIGALPNAVLSKLDGKRDLGIHSELFSDGVIEMVEKGVITNEAKSLHPGKIIAGFAFGSQRFYQFMHDNAMIELHPSDYVNDPFIIAQNRKMTAINSAIEVDLSGQVCADSIGGRIYSGIGGQVDFIRGAAHSKGGKAIIALPSTAKTGISRIVPRLKDGAGVVTSRGDIDHVVTEYGVASLHGKSLRERAHELIAVAHPQFREELRYFARQQGW
ncbi:MAG TPA: acetyl-CoA hydrolase/transferase C-terminal domain-containing protein [Anaerolineales bacterium]|nr:acetyl-CoA hydrolase/transferase C-terminal domain-containing protein [Anaerolineales bacterium]HLE72643.1 acetyl-CoA hydrolase/transferase C-terminal domain-containing protein [Anaerolineales bacterium]